MSELGWPDQDPTQDPEQVSESPSPDQGPDRTGARSGSPAPALRTETQAAFEYLQGEDLRKAWDTAKTLPERAAAGGALFREMLSGWMEKAQQRGVDPVFVPINETTPRAASVPPEIQSWRDIRQRAARMAFVQNTIETDPELQAAFEEFKGYQSIWKARRDAPLIRPKPNATEEEIRAYYQQFEALPIDQEQWSSWQNAINKAQQTIRDGIQDPNYNLFADRRVGAMLKSMTLQTGHRTEEFQSRTGAMFTPEDPAKDWAPGLGTSTALAVFEGAGATAGAIQNAITDLGLRIAEFMDPVNNAGITEDFARDEAFAVDENGQVVRSGRKVEGLDRAMQLWANLLGEDVQKKLAYWREARDTTNKAIADSGLLPQLWHGSANFVGGIAAFSAAAGPFLKAGQKVGAAIGQGVVGKTVADGIVALGGVERNTKAYARVKKTIEIMSGTAGVAAGNGFYEAAVYGNVEGLTKSFIHGAEMGLVLSTVGALGKRFETYLGRTKVPAFARRPLEGAYEGLLFGGYESVSGPLWTFVKDPTPETWADYVKVMGQNIIGMMMFKSVTRGPTPQQRAMGEVLQGEQRRADIRRLLEEGREAVEGKITPVMFEGAPMEMVRRAGEMRAEAEVLKQKQGAGWRYGREALKNRMEGQEAIQETAYEQLRASREQAAAERRAAKEARMAPVRARQDRERRRQLREEMTRLRGEVIATIGRPDQALSTQEARRALRSEISYLASQQPMGREGRQRLQRALEGMRNVSADVAGEALARLTRGSAEARKAALEEILDAAAIAGDFGGRRPYGEAKTLARQKLAELAEQPRDVEAERRLARVEPLKLTDRAVETIRELDPELGDLVEKLQGRKLDPEGVEIDYLISELNQQADRYAELTTALVRAKGAPQPPLSEIMGQGRAMGSIEYKIRLRMQQSGMSKAMPIHPTAARYQARMAVILNALGQLRRIKGDRRKRREVPKIQLRLRAKGAELIGFKGIADIQRGEVKRSIESPEELVFMVREAERRIRILERNLRSRQGAERAEPLMGDEVRRQQTLQQNLNDLNAARAALRRLIGFAEKAGIDLGAVEAKAQAPRTPTFRERMDAMNARRAELEERLGWTRIEQTVAESQARAAKAREEGQRTQAEMQRKQAEWAEIDRRLAAREAERLRREQRPRPGEPLPVLDQPWQETALDPRFSGPGGPIAREMAGGTRPIRMPEPKAPEEAPAEPAKATEPGVLQLNELEPLEPIPSPVEAVEYNRRLGPKKPEPTREPGDTLDARDIEPRDRIDPEFMTPKEIADELVIEFADMPEAEIRKTFEDALDTSVPSWFRQQKEAYPEWRRGEIDNEEAVDILLKPYVKESGDIDAPFEENPDGTRYLEIPRIDAYVSATHMTHLEAFSMARETAIEELQFAKNDAYQMTRDLAMEKRGAGIEDTIKKALESYEDDIVIKEFSEKEFRDTEDDDFIYHVTTRERARAIAETGVFEPGKEQSMAPGFYRDYAKGKVFFTERSGVSYWEGRIRDHLESMSDATPDLVVMRIPGKLVEMMEVDEVGERDSKSGAYYVTGPLKARTMTDLKMAMGPPQPIPTPPPRGGKLGYTNRDWPAARGEQRVADPALGRVSAQDLMLLMKGGRGDPVLVGMAAEGFNTQKGALLGFYNLPKHIIRMQNSRQLNTAAHEWAHSMQRVIVTPGQSDVLGMFNETMKKIPTDVLQDMAQATSQHWASGAYGANVHPAVMIAEAWAEFFARDLLGDYTLANTAPRATDFFFNPKDGWIWQQKDGRLGEQYRRIREGFQLFREQGAEDRIMSTITYGDEGKSEAKARFELREKGNVAQRVWRNFYKWFFDANAELHRSFKRGFSEAKEMGILSIDQKDLPITADPGRMVDLLQMTAFDVADRMLMTHTFGFDRRPGSYGESLADILRTEVPFDRAKKFWAYMKAKQDLQMLDVGMATGTNKQDLMTAVASWEAQNPTWANVARRVTEFSHRVLDYATEAGLFTPEEARRIKSAYPVYFPFHRNVFVRPSKEASTTTRRGGGIFRRRGAVEEVQDPTLALIDQTRSIIGRAHRLQAVKAIYNAAIMTEGIGNLATIVDRKTVPTTLDLVRVFDALKAEGKKTGGPQTQAEIERITKQVMNLLSMNEIGDTLTLFDLQVEPKKTSQIIPYRAVFRPDEIASMAKLNPAAARQMNADNGKIVFLEVHKDIIESLEGLDQQVRLPRALTIPTLSVRLGATVLSPKFWAKNTLRDSAVYPVFTAKPTQFEMLAPLAGGLHSWAVGARMGKSKDAHDRFVNSLYEDTGSSGATYVSAFSLRKLLSGGENQISEIERIWDVKGRGVGGVVKRFIEGGEKIGQHFESALRKGEFKKIYDQAIADGKPQNIALFEAMEGARESMTNFARTGTVARLVTQLVPYFSAGLAGQRKMIRALLGKEGTGKMGSAIGTMVGHFGALSVAAYLLRGEDSTWEDELPNWRKLGFWNFNIDGFILSIPKPFELGVLMTYPIEVALRSGDWSPDFRDYVQEIGVRQIGGVFFAMPAVIGPTTEVLANYSFFTGREVVPEWMRRSRSPLNQFTARTDPIWGHAVAQVLTSTIGWAFEEKEFSPMMTEHWIRQMTGGGSHTVSGILTSIYDGVTGDPWKALTENPINPLAAVSGQREFGQALSTDRLYALNSRLTRYKDSLSPTEQALRPIISAARDQIGVLNDLRRRGMIDRTEADRRAAEIARRALQTYEENVR